MAAPDWEAVKRDIFDADAPGTTAALRQHIITEAPRYGVDPALALAVVQTESNFYPQAVSPKGVMGLFQVTNDTGAQYGQTPETRTDYRVSTHAGLSELGKQLQNSGGNVSQALSRYGDPKDVGYAQRVMSNYRLQQASLGQREQPGGTPEGQAAPDWDAIKQQIFGQKPGTVPSAPADTTPAVVPNPDPTQPATLRYPGVTAPPAPAQAAPSSNMSGIVLDIAKPSATVALTPGMSDEQIIRAFGYDPALVQQAKLYQPGAFSSRITDPNSTLAKVAGTSLIPGTETATLGGMLHGLRQLPAGALQLATRGLRAAGVYSDADVAYHDLLEKIAEADYQQNVMRGKNVDPETGQVSPWDIGTMVGQAVTPLPIPGGSVAGAAGRSILRPTVGGVARSALTGAVAGGLQPVLDTPPTGADVDAFTRQKLLQAGTGAALSPIVEYGLARPLMWGVNKSVNFSRGVFTHPEDAALVDQAAAHGIDPTYADIRGAMQAPGASRTETFLERVPGAGAGTVRQREQTQAKTAAEAFHQHYVGEANQASYDALNQVSAMAQRGDGAAQRAVTLAQQAGDDPGKIMQASAALNLQSLRGRAQYLYGQVRQQAQTLGDVPPTRTLAQAYAVLDAIDQSALNVDPTGRTRAQIVQILDRFEPQPGTPHPITGQPSGPPRPQPSPYAVMDKLSNDLGKVIDQTGMQDTYGATMLRAIKTAVDDDMRTFALQSGRPGLVAAQHAADAFYPQVVRQRELVRSMENKPSDELMQYMFQPRRGERAEQWYQALDTKGQAAARAELLTQALYDGPRPAINPTTGTFSPARFAGNLEGLRAVTGVVFPRGQAGQFEVNGFVNVMRHIERAGQYAENPPTGQRLTSWIQMAQSAGAAVAGGAAGGPLGAIAAPLAALAGEAAAGRLAKVLLMNPRGRDFLLTASRLSPNSPQWARLLNDMASSLPALTAATVGGQIGRGSDAAEETQAGVSGERQYPIPVSGNIR